MSITSFENFDLDLLHEQFVGKRIERLSGPYTLPREGIITDIVRNEWHTSAVILWDEDHESEDMPWADSDDLLTVDATVNGAVEVLTLNTITSTYRWKIGE